MNSFSIVSTSRGWATPSSAKMGGSGSATMDIIVPTLLCDCVWLINLDKVLIALPSCEAKILIFRDDTLKRPLYPAHLTAALEWPHYKNHRSPNKCWVTGWIPRYRIEPQVSWVLTGVESHRYPNGARSLNVYWASSLLTGVEPQHTGLKTFSATGLFTKKCWNPTLLSIFLSLFLSPHPLLISFIPVVTNNYGIFYLSAPKMH